MRKNNERGQSMVMTVVFMVVLLGFAALVIDVGSWYRAHRSAQATADASALAGAAVLPDTAAASVARQRSTRPRTADRRAPAVRRSRSRSPGYEMDTIKVKVTRPSPGFFARVFGSKFMNVTVSGTATARAYNVQGIQERHRADHRQLQAPAAELHPRAEPDVQSDVRDADAAAASRTSTRPAARTPPAHSG